MNKFDHRFKNQFRFYTFLAIVYSTLMITAQAMAYRFIQIGPFEEPGGIFIFPVAFALNDVIAEVYGPTLARGSIYYALFAQAFFSFVPIGVNALPYPHWWNYLNEYRLVYGASWLVFASNLAAVMLGMLINTQIIGKTKLMAGGRFFPIRSIFSSVMGEFILTIVIVSIAIIPIKGVNESTKLFINMFLFKFIFSFVAVFPVSLLVAVLKRLDNADVYDKMFR